MKKNSVVEFYIKVGLWSFFCLGLGGICNLVKAEILNFERSGNESDAAQIMQNIRISQIRYSEKHRGKFAPNFDELVRAKYLDEDSFSGSKNVVNGYIFEIKAFEPTDLKPAFYSINADPQTSEGFFKTPIRHFYFDSTLGTVKVTDENRQANANDASF
jgi:hypothetical protein